MDLFENDKGGPICGFDVRKGNNVLYNPLGVIDSPLRCDANLERHDLLWQGLVGNAR